MDPILNDYEYTEVDGRAYLNPQVALDRQNAFVQNLRDSQAQQNRQIQTDTYNLGTEVPSNIGGLTSPVANGNGGAGLSYFTSRYQVPQTNAAVANLRATAQAAALNQALENEQAIWKKRYQDAYRKYQKSAYDKANAPTTTGGGDDDGTKGGVNEGTTELEGRGRMTLDSNDLAQGGYWVAGYGDAEHPNNTMVHVGADGSNTTYYQQPDGSYSTAKPGSDNTGGGPSIDLIQLITDYQYKGHSTLDNKKTANGFSGR